MDVYQLENGFRKIRSAPKKYPASQKQNWDQNPGLFCVPCMMCFGHEMLVTSYVWSLAVSYL